MLSHDLANELLALPNQEVLFDDDGEGVEIEAVDDEDGAIWLSEGDDDEETLPDSDETETS